MFGRDNPGGDWLRNKQKVAEEQARQYPLRAAGKMISGAVTAYTREAVMIDISAVRNLPGACDERRHPGDFKYDALIRSVEESGWDVRQMGNAILIGVNQKGEACIVEGNTRVAVAAALGEQEIRGEIRWFNGGEDAPGPFSLADGNFLTFCRAEGKDFAPAP